MAGAVTEGLKVASHWARSADPSLVRFFIVALLRSVAPPFSQVGVLHHAVACDISLALSHSRTSIPVME